MTTVQEDMLQRYADVILRVGLSLQAGQQLVIRALLEAAPLVRSIAARAYQLGSPLVTVIWADEYLDLLRLRHAPRNTFGEFPGWVMDGLANRLKRGDAYLQIAGETPDLLGAEDPGAKSEMSKAFWASYKPVMALQDDNTVTWSVVSAATVGWATKVFPALAHDAALHQLWEAIFDLCRLRDHDPVGAWLRHLQDLSARCHYLNRKQYSSLRYSSPHTDLSVALPDGHLWLGGSTVSKANVSFTPNLPTEEVFTCPHFGRVSGTVVSTRPLSYMGTTVEGIALTFSEGKVTHASAARGEDVLRGLLETDQGSCRLGEVALVPRSSPVAKSQLIFHNTLFDENAASHLALGQGYKSCIGGAPNLTDPEFEGLGGNVSSIHVDFMIGADELAIDGVLPSGSSEPVMRNGDWAFSPEGARGSPTTR